MRKIKKVNGYLVVRFSDRERVDYETLGTYGVIDAELYTGHIDVDRGAFEYDDADTLEVAIEQARGLESELDAEEGPATYTIVKETDEATTEDEINPDLMLAGWKTQLASQVQSHHYPEVNPHTAAHQLYGFMVALKQLGLIEEDGCYVVPDTFQPEPREDFRHPTPGAPTRKTYELGLALLEKCPDNDCMIYRNTFQMCRELDEQIALVNGRARGLLEVKLYKLQHELFKMWVENYAVQEYRREAWSG